VVEYTPTMLAFASAHPHSLLSTLAASVRQQASRLRERSASHWEAE
jgi:hypothetical protein